MLQELRRQGDRCELDGAALLVEEADRQDSQVATSADARHERYATAAGADAGDDRADRDDRMTLELDGIAEDRLDAAELGHRLDDLLELGRDVLDHHARQRSKARASAKRDYRERLARSMRVRPALISPARRASTPADYCETPTAVVTGRLVGVCE
jgi:hypothetical protein